MKYQKINNKTLLDFELSSYYTSQRHTFCRFQTLLPFQNLFEKPNMHDVAIKCVQIMTKNNNDFRYEKCTKPYFKKANEFLAKVENMHVIFINNMKEHQNNNMAFCMGLGGIHWKNLDVCVF